MSDIPDHYGLTDLFNNVTTSMLAMDCTVANDLPGDPKEYHSTAILPIAGDGGFTLAVSSDLQGCTILSAAMFAVDATEVDSEMINDTMAELANMAAGQLKGRLSLGNSLGLPVNIGSKEYAERAADSANGWSHFPMRAGKAVVLLSITTQTFVAEEYIGL